MENNSWRKGIVLAGVFAAGALLMHWWDSRRESSVIEPPVLSLADDSGPAEEPVSLTPEEPSSEPNQGEVPSHLSTIDVSDIQTIMFGSGEELSLRSSQDEGAAAVFLPSVTVKPNLEDVSMQQGVEQAADDTNRMSMISAPVSAKMISSLEEYRAFKRAARGNYPAVDFKKQQVLVLESASNWPDKVFEIVSVDDVDGKRVVSYRVNVFGLDKKINTHSAVAVNKKDLPLELKQVL